VEDSSKPSQLPFASTRLRKARSAQSATKDGAALFSFRMELRPHSRAAWGSSSTSAADLVHLEAARDSDGIHPGYSRRAIAEGGELIQQYGPEPGSALPILPDPRARKTVGRPPYNQLLSRSSQLPYENFMSFMTFLCAWRHTSPTSRSNPIRCHVRRG